MKFWNFESDTDYNLKIEHLYKLNALGLNHEFYISWTYLEDLATNT